MNPATIQVEDLRKQLTDHLADELFAVNEILRRQLRSSSDFVSDLTEHVSRFQGKQIRPMLMLLFARMIAGKTSQPACSLAAAVEMIHTATLVHDDVIDEAGTRRHVATVHRRWNTETSVLFGDYLFSKSFHLAASTGDAEACRLIGLATDRTCEGELNQTAARLTRSSSELDYFRIIRDKTGQLFGLSCLLGARCAGANVKGQRAARRYGIRLGLAFQIADDILDLTQDAAATGKDAFNDLQNGRMTLPLLRAMALADPRERDVLTMILNPESDVSMNRLSDLECVRAGLESAQETALDIASRASRDLRDFPAGADQTLLESIAAFAVRRHA